MGCCISTGRASSGEKAQKFPVKIESFHQKPNLENRAPPPSFEEVTVKEVLSISKIPKLIPPLPVPKIEEEDEKPREEKPTAEKIGKDENVSVNKVSLKSPASTITTQSAAINESEDVSEICSLSESISTTTITEKRDDGEEVTQRVSRRSSSPARMTTRTRTRESTPRRDRVVGRPDPSPRKRNTNPVVNSGSVKPKRVRNRDPGQPGFRRGSRPAPKLKDPGERSGRRSRSPAVQRSVTGRNQSPKRANPSPSRVRAEPNEIAGNCRRLEEKSTSEGKFPVSQSSAPNESFDNPHVSLECFIFL